MTWHTHWEVLGDHMYWLSECWYHAMMKANNSDLFQKSSFKTASCMSLQATEIQLNLTCATLFCMSAQWMIQTTLCFNWVSMISEVVQKEIMHVFYAIQEQAQAICKVLSTAFDSVLMSEKSWFSPAAQDCAVQEAFVRGGHGALSHCRLAAATQKLRKDLLWRGERATMFVVLHHSPDVTWRNYSTRVVSRTIQNFIFNMDFFFFLNHVLYIDVEM